MSTPSTIKSSVPFKGRRLLQARLRMRLKGLVLHDRRKGCPAADSVMVWVNLARRAACIKVRLGRMIIGRMCEMVIGRMNGAVGEEVSGIESAVAIGRMIGAVGEEVSGRRHRRRRHAGDDVALCSRRSAKQLLSEMALSQVTGL